MTKVKSRKWERKKCLYVKIKKKVKQGRDCHNKFSSDKCIIEDIEEKKRLDWVKIKDRWQIREFRVVWDF